MFGDQLGIKTLLRMPRALNIGAFLQGIFPIYLEHLHGKAENEKPFHKGTAAPGQF